MIFVEDNLQVKVITMVITTFGQPMGNIFYVHMTICLFKKSSSDDEYKMN